MEFLKFLVDMYVKGGVFMHPLLVVAIVSIVLVIERLLYLRENSIDFDRFQFELRSALKENNLERAIATAAKTKGLIGRVMQEARLRVKAGETDVASAAEKEILSEMRSMEKSRGWLGAMISVAPLLGLIGSVQGILQCVVLIERSAQTDPRMLAVGIYTALITTFAGLLIAIPASLAQEHIRKKLNNLLNHLDLYIVEVREWLERRPQAAAVQSTTPTTATPTT